MQLFKWATPLALISTIAFLAPLHAQTNTTHASLYQQAGLDQQLSHLWQQVQDEYSEQPKSTDSNVSNVSDKAALSLINALFSEPQLRRTILEHWQEHLTKSELSSISSWLTSPAGRALTLAEINASIQQDDTELLSYWDTLHANKPSKARIDLLRALDTSVRSSAASTDMGILINLAAITALHASGLAPANTPTTAQRAKEHEGSRKLISAMTAQDILRYNLFTYRNFNNQSIQQYIDFAKSPAGVKYHKETFFAVRAAMTQATLELQQQLHVQKQPVKDLKH